MLAVQVQYLTYEENKRHNLATEGENVRHNQETERLGFETLAETHRSNIVHESQEWTKIDQNQQSINEAVRHNKASESIQLISANAAAMNAQTNRMLAHAQVPLIEAQTQQTKENTEKIKKETSLTGQKYMTEQYNTMVAKSTADWSDWLNMSKTINNVIPF